MPTPASVKRFVFGSTILVTHGPNNLPGKPRKLLGCSGEQATVIGEHEHTFKARCACGWEFCGQQTDGYTVVAAPQHPAPAFGTRVKYLGDVANLPYTGTVVAIWMDRWGSYMDVRPDAPEGVAVEVRRGVPIHAFPETGPGARWVLAGEGERRDFYAADLSLANIG